MPAPDDVDTNIDPHDACRDELVKLRGVLLKAGLDEAAIPPPTLDPDRKRAVIARARSA